MLSWESSQILITYHSFRLQCEIMYSAVSGWMEWGASKPYRATDIPLETETVDESEAVTEAAPTQVQDTSDEISPDPLPTEELVQQEGKFL